MGGSLAKPTPCPSCPTPTPCPTAPPCPAPAPCPPCVQNIDDLTLLNYRIFLFEMYNRGENAPLKNRYSEQALKQKVDGLRQKYGEIGSKMGILSDSANQERLTRDLIDWVNAPVISGASALGTNTTNYSPILLVLLLILAAAGVFGVITYSKSK